jgi:hypothetical protein
MQNHVTINNNNVITLHGSDGFIANRTRAKSIIFSPDMMQRTGEVLLKFSNHIFGRRRRTIVSNQYL